MAKTKQEIDRIDRIKRLAEKAWMLSESEILAVKPDSDISLVESHLDLDVDVSHPLQNFSYDDVENLPYHLFKIMRNPDYFPFTCKLLFDIDIYPFQHVILKNLWTKTFPMLVATRGFGKTFLMGVYVLLRLLFTQGSKIVVVGSSYRQSKLVFDYIEGLWSNAPIIKEICGSGTGRNGREQGPRRDVDRCEMIIGDSIAVFIPLGNGQKIRGLRSNYTVADEYSSISEEIYQNVVRGFGAVSANPVANAKNKARIRLLKQFGLWTDENEREESKHLQGNQNIITGSAYYAFNHFAKTWRLYKSIIESRGNVKKLEEIFQGPVPKHFNWRDFCIMRIPADMMPEGFMDDKQIASARVALTRSQFLMEMGACVTPDTKIITDNGTKEIIDIEVGDKVLTHKGRFRKVIKKTYRYQNGKIIKFKSLGTNFVNRVTPEHPFWIDGNWTALQNVESEVHLKNLYELNGETEIDLRTIVSDYMEYEDSIYPRWSSSRFSREEVAAICSSPLKQSELAKQYGVRQGTISSVLNRKKPKKTVPSKIKLDYDFGMIVGYYASEGSGSGDNRSINFALDGHTTTPLKNYVEQLCKAINKVFGLKPKIYKKDRNTKAVHINNRLVHELLRYICPGVSHTKRIRPEILYSNKDFLRGFIVGYWNGNGHLPKNIRTNIIAGCVNLDLLSQIRTALSYFGVSSTLSTRKKGKTVFRGKECNTKQVFCLVMNGQNARRFREIFYSQKLRDHGKTRMRNNGEFSSLPITEKEYVDYDGFVYNLEVEEDNSYSLLNATVHNCFASDSDGFFRRSLIEKCVVGKPDNPIVLPSGEVNFQPTLYGDRHIRYVYGIDPASQVDNFAIVIVGIYPDHRRIVYCWTVRKKSYQAKLKRGIVKEHNFYAYCARKIRDLMKVFPCERIAMDSQGGGFAVEEALYDPKNMEPGELPIWQAKDPDPKKWKETDDKPGLHILELVNFASAEYTSEANHGMKMDFENKVLLFPYSDALSDEIALEEDKMAGRIVSEGDEDVVLYDTLGDCVADIEELKDELASIVMTATQNGRERWDVPETIEGTGESRKKRRRRKDRYSALLMANMSARRLGLAPQTIEYSAGGFAHVIGGQDRKDKPKGSLYVGADWYVQGSANVNGGIVVKRK